VKITAGMAEKDGIKFAVAQMDSSIVDVPGRARDMVQSLQTVFPNVNIVLMTRDKRNSPVFYGRPDVVNGLGDAALTDVLWKEYEVDTTSQE
jgi:hypothetical protein